MAFIPNWSPTAYYNQGDKVIYIDTPYILTVPGSTAGVFGNPPPSNPAAWSITTVGGGVASLAATQTGQQLTGNLAIEPGAGISVSQLSPTQIQVSNLNPSVVQQGIVGLQDTVGNTTTLGTGSTNLLTATITQTGSTPTADFAVNPGLTSNMVLDIVIPAFPAFPTLADPIVVPLDGFITTSGNNATGITIGNGGVLSVGAGTGITSSGGQNPTIGNGGVLDLTQGSGISITGSLANYTITNNVLSKYGTNNSSLSLTGAFANMAILTFTTTIVSQPLLVWGNLNLLAGSSGGVVETQLVIAGTTGDVYTTTLTNGHYQVLTLLGRASTPASIGTFNVNVQARVISGSATKQKCAITVVGQSPQST